MGNDSESIDRLCFFVKIGEEESRNLPPERNPRFRSGPNLNRRTHPLLPYFIYG